MDKKVMGDPRNKSDGPKNGQNDCKKLVLLVASFFLNFFADGIAYAFGIFVTKIVKDFPTSGMSGVSWIPCIMTTMTHVGGPIGSILIKKFGWRVVSILGSLLAGGGFAVSYWAPNVPTLVATVGVAGGFGFTLLYLPSMVSLPEYFSGRRSLAVGIAVSGSGIGTFFFSWAFGLILSHYNWRQAILITGGIIFSTILLALAYPARKSLQPQNQQQQECPDDPETGHSFDPIGGCGSPKKNKKLVDLLSLFRNVPLLIFLLADLLMTMAYHVPFVYLPAIEETMVINYGWESNSNSLLIVMTGAGVVGRILIGSLSDQKWVSRLHIYSICLVGAGIVTISSHHIESKLWLRVVWSLYGFCMGHTSLKTVILVDLVGLGKLTDVLGLCLLLEAIGFLIGAPVVGFLYDNFGTYAYGFYFMGVMSTLSALMVVSIPWIQRGQQSSQKGQTALYQ